MRGWHCRRKAQKSAKDSIKSATTKAVADPWSYVTWARGIYDDFNDMMDMNKKSESLYDDAKNAEDHGGQDDGGTATTTELGPAGHQDALDG